MGDPLMEARTMALLEFGCPPLPIANGRRMETDEPACINSHDLISVFMAQAFKQRDNQLNSERRQRQAEIEDTYYRQLLQSDGSFESIYSTMAGYTRDYLGCFLLHPFTVNDVRVLPPDHISPMLLNEIRDYLNALLVIHDAPKREEGLTHTLRSYLIECHRILCHKELNPYVEQNP
jgi:malate synthase